ncbi:hypothetical protein BS47DRAFT_580019 [Hydnum rufescens UP504]|uniref:LIM zinc-binding domain-containing protein n=1 Tax=Hydnum rufescens UP504 TaxID=1448309 RepID=A0A9P6AG84_9AGAM|nr:hypothetical protein BS47DRAFT_580019 [Hydnum rufescens UP504]
MAPEMTCFTCGGSLKGPYVAAHGQNYHSDHFRCTVCATILHPHETNYWCDKLVYCRFHYSTRFAPKCTGCTTAVLAHSVTRSEGECWHPECYAINKFWSVKLAPLNREALKLDTTRRQYEIEEQSYESKALISEQTQIQDQVHRIWDHLSTYEISVAICLKSCISSILGLSANRGVHSDSETWWTKLKLHCDALLHAIDAFAPPPPTSAELQALGQTLRDQIRYLYASCSPSSTFKVDKLVENHMIHLIHDILSRVLSSTLHLTRQQRDSRLTKVFELLDQLRQAITEQPSSLPLVDPDDFKAVYETPPFDTLGWNRSIESRFTHAPEVAGPLMPQPVIPVHLGMGTIGPLRGTAAPPKQTGVFHRASIRRPLGHAVPGAIVMTAEDPPKLPRGNMRGRSILPALGGQQRKRATTPPPAVVKASRPKSPQIIIQRSSSRSSSRPRQSSNASVASAERARSKAQAPVKHKPRNPAPQPALESVQPPAVVPRSQRRRSSPPRVVHMETAGPVVKPTSSPSGPALR